MSAPVTVQALGTDLSRAATGQPVTAGAKVVAERATVLKEVAIAATGPNGARVDFPHVFNWKVGTSQKVFDSSRAFDRAGTYTYWFAYRQGKQWFHLQPKQSFQVGNGTPTPSTSPSSTPAPTPTSTPAPTSTPTSTSAPAPAGWPGPTNTGVPAGTVLTTYTGPMTISVANTVIDAKIVNGSLNITAPGVVVSRSKVYGTISNGASRPSFTVRDSEVIAAAGQTNIGDANFIVERSNLHGGNRAVYAASHGTVRDSWIHGTRIYPSSQHASGIRLGQYSLLYHNSIACDMVPTPDDGGCSAPITGYPDFAPIHHNTVERNLILASPYAAFGAYGGNTQGKPYSGDTSNATYIVFRDNVFQRGPTGKCAAYGPITDFAASRTGNVWQNNRYDTGELINP
ncbi:MAG: hypothetical protein ACM30G_23120 [Micromonosporaceae bacterium]